MEDSIEARSLAKKLEGRGKEDGAIVLLSKEEYMVLTRKTTYIELKQPNLLWKDKVNIHDNLCKAKPGSYANKKSIKDEYIRISGNSDDITIRIPTKYKDRNVFLLYTDE